MCVKIDCSITKVKLDYSGYGRCCFYINYFNLKMGGNPAVHLCVVKLKAFVIVLSRSSNAVKTREHFMTNKSNLIIALLIKKNIYFAYMISLAQM